MSSHGFLYITEVIRDTFERELDKVFGKNNWSLDGSNYDIWDLRDLPDVMNIKVLYDEDGETVLGEIEVSNRFFIERGMTSKYIEVEPDKLIKIKRRKDEK